MKVKFALLCDFASKTDTGKLNLMGVFDEISAPALPYHHPQMFLVVQYEATPGEAGSHRELGTILLGADSEQIFSASQEVVIPEPSAADRNLTMAQLVCLNGLSFEWPGDYHFSIRVNDEEGATVGLRIHAPMPPVEEIP